MNFRSRKPIFHALAIAALSVVTVAPANAGSLTFTSLTKMTNNGTSFNLSVFDGKASYQPNADTGSTTIVTLGDGTLLDWKLLGGSNLNNQVVNSNNVGYANGPAAYINNPTSTSANGVDPAIIYTPESWGKVWTSDPGTNFSTTADQTTYTVLNSGANTHPMGPITGTVDVSTLASGQFYIFAGGYKGNTDYILSLSGPGQTTLNASLNDGINTSNNRVNSVLFEFTNPGGLYDTLTWTYKHNSSAARGRIMGVALDNEIVGPGDTTPPLISGADITDDVTGGPILVDHGTVTYTLTFSEAMNAATITTADFENSGTATATIDQVNTTANPATFEVEVTPSTVGTLVLQIKSGSELKDLAGNDLDTTSAIADDATIAVDPLEVVGPSLVIANPSVLQSVLVGSGPVTRSVTITNGSDTQTLNLTGVSFSGTAGTQFTLPTFPSSLAPGASGTIDFTFTPGTPGVSTATMTVVSNAEGSPSTAISLQIQTLTNLAEGITYQAWQANRPLTAMPTLVNDQTPNIDELRTSINFKDSDKDGVADVGADYGFGAIPPLDRLENLYCEMSGVINITNAGDYQLRLTADDGARLEIDGSLVIDNSSGVQGSPQVLDSSVIPLSAGYHDLLVTFWSGSGSPCLKLEWKRPGSGIWETIGAYDSSTQPDGFRTDDYTRVVSTGDKAVYYPEQGQSSGELSGLHPGYDLFTIAGDFGAAGGDSSLNPPDILIEGTSTPYRPQTGGIGFLSDGTLLQTNFTPYNFAKDVPPPDDATANDKIYAVSGASGADISAVTVRVVADGLNSPMGVVEVGDDLYVAEVLKITRLRDINDDGDYIDPEDTEEVIAPIVADSFHNWTFGLIHQDGWLYCTLSADIGGTDSLGANGYAPSTRGNWFRVCIDSAQAPVGTTEQLAGGLRTPNGLGLGPEGKMFGTDNQGSWNPDNSLYELTPGHFYGHYNLWFQFSTTDPVINPQGVPATGLADPTRQPSDFWDSDVYWDGGETPIYANPFNGSTRRFTRPAVYLQQNSMCNSPTDPLLIGDQHSTFKGQMFVGEHSRGGIRRVFLEKINGRFQGCVMRFTQGLSIGANSMRWGPDGALYSGGVGATRGWQWRDTTFGLDRLKFNGNDAFEIQTMRAVTGGFIVTMTKPITPGVLANIANYLPVEIASYPGANYNYGEGKVDGASLVVTSAEELPDGRSVRLTIPGLMADTTAHLRMTDNVVSDTGELLWSGEAYYTLNELPNDFESEWAGWVTTHFTGSADLDVVGLGADPDFDGTNNFGEFFSGSNPRVANPRDMIGISGNAASLTLISREPVTIPVPLEVRWQSSDDLANWTDITDDVSLEGELPADPDFVKRSYRLDPTAPPARLFIRRALVLTP